MCARRECPWDGITCKEVNSSHTTDLVPSRSEGAWTCSRSKVSPASGEMPILCWDWIGAAQHSPLVRVSLACQSLLELGSPVRLRNVRQIRNAPLRRTLIASSRQSQPARSPRAESQPITVPQHEHQSAQDLPQQISRHPAASIVSQINRISHANPAYWSQSHK
jgi:hypothetical protein